MTSSSAPLSGTQFVHLRLHTEFSVVDSTVRIDDAVAAAQQDAQPALALTDLSNVFGGVKFYKGARGAGVKPLLGAEVWLEGVGAEVSAKPTKLLLLVASYQGYLNLCEILSLAWTKSPSPLQAVVRWQWLEAYATGLIALSGAQAGALGQALLQNDEAKSAHLAGELSTVFEGRFYIELQRADRPEDEPHVQAAVQLAAKLHLPVVATHPIQFMTADDYEAHEARICIAEGEILGNQRRVRKFTPAQYFKSQAEMCDLFVDVPSAIANTLEIAKRCNLELTLGKSRLPNFPTPDRDGSPIPIADYFREQSFAGLEERLAVLFPDAALRDQKRPEYVSRLEFEIAVILKMEFPGYFLIVGDFINWAKNNGCPVGPGRGSGAGSLVAYSLKITDLDPLEYNLLFERFLNPDRVSMPDFDIDFCQSNRDRVIDYVKDKYGAQAVSQIATFGTMAARGVVRDVGRVLDLSYNYCDGISKLIPNKPGTHITLAQALKDEPQLAERHAREDDLQTLMELSQKLEGLTRNVGMHAGGVLIAPGKLTDFCPIYQQPGGDSAVSQFDKDDVEAIGLVKFDFLGLATLTILEIAKDLIRARHKGQADFTFEALLLDDPKVYKLFTAGNTEAVFQFESRGMQSTLKDAKPTRFEDLIALNALYRPGPMDNIPSFVARKHGREEIVYPHPMTADMLSETYGIMVYQEQVMQTAQILGGYSLGGADLLRRAMGKKKAEEMAEHREIFRNGCAKNEIAPERADEIFDLMEKFAGYGFNKSHAAAYSLLAYHTAWLKVHYAAEFYCANMTVEMGNTDKLKVLVDDAKENGISFEPPNINRSGYEFTPVLDTVVRYGLGAIKGTGQQAVQAMLQARSEGGAFSSLFDFLNRIDKSKLNKRTVEALIKAGAFDTLHPDRASCFASLDLAFEYAAAQARNANQSGLFDMDDSHGSANQEPELVRMTPWDVREQLIFEKSAIGFYLTGHLFDAYAAEARQFVKREIGELIDSREPQLLCGLVSDLRVINGNRGRIGLFTLDDKTGAMEATCDEAVLSMNKDTLTDDAFVVVQAVMQMDRFSGGFRLKINKVWDLPSARCRFAKHLLLPSTGFTVELMHQMVKDYPPKSEITEQGEFFKGLSVCLTHQVSAHTQGAVAIENITGASVRVELGDKARFFPSDAALAGWYAAAGAEQVSLVY